MNGLGPADSLHRLFKQAIDSGTVESIAEAEALFAGYRLSIEYTAEADDAVQQATLLTSVALARRIFLGGVIVSGSLHGPVVVPLPLGPTLADAVVQLGATVNRASVMCPTIVIGGGRAPRRDIFAVRTATAGWRGGILPLDHALSPPHKTSMPLAGMLAAGIAINEAFLHVNGGMPAAGRRVVGLSLWEPSTATDWISSPCDEPALRYLPNRLWLLGLGHLGQAYLWGLGLLPYRKMGDLSLVLQDIDIITASSESTSILSDASLIGHKKTRAMALWAERRGFDTVIMERRFEANFKRDVSEPAIALCGLDNAESRRALDQVGFELIIEAGLGRGHRNFRSMRLHTLPGPRLANEIWKTAPVEESVKHQPAYQRLLTEKSLDQCGMTQLAGKAVGAPFVGAIAATIALSEILRLLHGGRVHNIIDVDLLSVDHRYVSIPRAEFEHLNPGFVAIDGKN